LGAHSRDPLANPPCEAATVAAASSLLIVSYALLAVAKALRDRRSPRDQRGLIGEPLSEIGVILLYDVEHGVLGKVSMILGKESMQVSELFVVHGFRASAATPKLYRNLLIPCQLSRRLVTFRERIRMVISAPRRTRIAGSQSRPLTIC